MLEWATIAGEVKLVIKITNKRTKELQNYD